MISLTQEKERHTLEVNVMELGVKVRQTSAFISTSRYRTTYMLSVRAAVPLLELVFLNLHFLFAVQNLVSVFRKDAFYLFYSQNPEIALS